MAAATNRNSWVTPIYHKGMNILVSATEKTQQTRTITSANPEQIRILLGVQDAHLKRIQQIFPVRIVAREGKIILSGEITEVRSAAAVIEQMIDRIKRHKTLSLNDVEDVLKGTPSSDVLAAAEEQPASAHQSVEPRVVNEMPLRIPSLSIAPRSRGQARYLKAIEENDLVFCGGPAGSGKTYLAVAMALHCLKAEQVRKIVLVRPAVEAGEKLGFLPGDMLAKVNPFLRPLLDALRDMLDYEQVQRYMEHDVIEIVPLAFMRGRTLNETFMILDEAQNTTITQMKMFLTRMGTGSKIVVTGDETQNDLPSHVPSGLNDAMRRLKGIPGAACVYLSREDIVRHRLVREIVKAYDSDEGKGNGNGGNGSPADKPAVENAAETN